jgi:hypothetical protein
VQLAPVDYERSSEASVKEPWRKRRRVVARQLKALAPDLAEFKAPPERPDVADLGRDRDLTSLVLAEYTAIRNEIQTALSNQQSALSVGAATLGLLAAVGARFWPDDLVLGGLVFSLAVPAACAMAVRMWYGELLRIARAARFIAQLERWANRMTGSRTPGLRAARWWPCEADEPSATSAATPDPQRQPARPSPPTGSSGSSPSAAMRCRAASSSSGSSPRSRS